MGVTRVVESSQREPQGEPADRALSWLYLPRDAGQSGGDL
jgi:hypothetical protein